MSRRGIRGGKTSFFNNTYIHNEAVKIEVTEPEVEQKHVKELTLDSEGAEITENAENEENLEDKKEDEETKETTEDQDSDESEGVKQVKFEEP